LNGLRYAGALVINRRFITIVAWCREITIPAAVLAALVIASSPAKDIYSQLTAADADVTEVAASLPTGTLSTAAADPAAATPGVDIPAVKAPVMAALEVPDERLAAPLAEDTARTNPAIPQVNESDLAIDSIEIVDECFVIETCVDRYLWQLYDRTRKEDSVRERTQKEVTVKRKGKLVTVTRTSSVVVDQDFGWKDPNAAKRAEMALAEYVIGGVDRDFKLRLFQMLHAADQAGLAPGITSAFRDDYRQSIANGLKAANDRSFHGGSSRGGYGHGLAADIVSTKGATRSERLGNSNLLWKWVDDHGREFGLGRPYLGRDPPHIAPIDGDEYARHRPGARTRQAAASH
jgi:D-alanyl-D-alanine carboxypeptidase